MSDSASDSMLEVVDLTCGYGDIVAVDALSFTVGAGEIFGLVGANGAGKSATIMALAGLLPVRAGSVRLAGRDITSMPAHARIDRGIALVPAGRRVFADLSVDENLTVGGTRRPDRDPRIRPSRVDRPGLGGARRQRRGRRRSGVGQVNPRVVLTESSSAHPPPGSTSSPRTFCPP